MKPIANVSLGTKISRDSTRFMVFLWFCTLLLFSLSVILVLDSAQMVRDGIFVNAVVVSNRTEENSTGRQFYSTVAFTPEAQGSVPPVQVRAELTSETGFIEGSEVSILYNPADINHIQLFQTRTDIYLSLLSPIICLLLLLMVSFNLLMRMRGDVVFVPDPEDTGELNYTPTAEEDAEYDRNKAASVSVIYGEVDGKWGKLFGKALRDANREERSDLKKFRAIGVGMILAAILCVILGGGLNTFALLFAFTFSFLGIVFCVIGFWGHNTN